VVVAIEPGRPGQVRAHGEIWRAAAPEAIDAGARVRVTGIEGLTLTVEKM
jgi:membrane protein implicated in regulation of membrane protease activity